MASPNRSIIVPSGLESQRKGKMGDIIIGSDQVVLSRLLAPYNGRDDPKEWLRTFKKVALISEWANSKCRVMAYAFMQGEADKWYG